MHFHSMCSSVLSTEIEPQTKEKYMSMLITINPPKVFAWGSNGDGQLGQGHSSAVREPQLLVGLSGKSIRQISAGRTHSAAWTAPPPLRRTPGK